MSRPSTQVRRSTRFVPIGFSGGSAEAERLASELRCVPWVLMTSVQARRGKGIGVRVVSMS